MPFFDPIRIGASASGTATAYSVDRSLRFDNVQLPLTRTPSSTSNRKTMTFSLWFKRAVDTNFNSFLIGYGNASNRHGLDFVSGGQLRLWGNYNGSVALTVQPTQVFRDFSAWYHFVLAIDTTQGTASNRVKMYVNGVQITDFATASYPSQDFEFAFNDQNAETQIGSYSKLYLAEIHEIDGFAYDPSYFGETDAITGQWNPKKYVGSYGTNGFYLNFSDNSGTTATTLGKDSSGNGNNFTPTNLTTGDAVKDTPTNNFATLQMMGTPFSSGASFAEGNLKFTTGSSGSARNLNRQAFAPILVNSGKWYAEFVGTSSGNANFIGVGSYQVMISPTANNTRYAFVYSDGDSYVNTNGSESIATYGGGIAVNNVVGVYLDMDASPPVVYFSSNGQWADGSGNFDESSPTGGLTLGDSFFTTDTGGNDGFAAFILSSASSSYNMTIHANFGQDSTFAGLKTAGGNVDANGIGDFAYAVPTGAKALCTANLPDPTILLPNKHFDTLLWTGTAASHILPGLNFQPDWFWAKSRSQAYHHTLMDSVRGVDRQLWTNRTNGEQTDANFLTSFNSNGLTLGDNSSGTGATNTNGHTYVGWNWNAGDTDGKTYAVTVVDDSGNKYRFDGFGTSAVTLDLAEGGTYVFDWSDSSAQSHPVRFSTTADGTHGGGTEYTTGVVKDDSAYKTTITVAASAPTLYYYCQFHSGMGGQVNTNSTLGSSNFDGTIQSVVKTSPTAGFSITAYSGNGSNAQTVGHGLGVAPDVIILKARGASQNWRVWHRSLAADGSKRLLLDSTNASEDAGFLNDTAPTSTLFTLGNSDDAWNASGGTYITYLFSEVAGYSKFGTYRGNGSSDGTFVFTGFRPAFILTKRSDGTTPWRIFDSKRPNANFQTYKLEADSSGAELTGYPYADFLSNGFKIRDNGSYQNANGGTYIYLCFAESPFKNARAR